MDWLAQILSLDLALLILGVSAILLTAKVVGKRLPKAPWTKSLSLIAWRLEYVFPLVLSVPGALWLPGLFAGRSSGPRLLEGLIAGFLTHWAAKMWKRIVLDKPAEQSPPPPPTTEGEVP